MRPTATSAGLMAGLGPIDDRADALAGTTPSGIELFDQLIHRPAAAGRQLRISRSSLGCYRASRFDTTERSSRSQIGTHWTT